MEWGKIALLVACALSLWFISRTIRSNPIAFSKDKLNKSFYTVGWLALCLMGAVLLAVLFLKGY